MIIINHILNHLAKQGKFDKVNWLKHLYVQDLAVLAVDHVTEENIIDSKEDDGIDLSRLKAKEKEMQEKK